MNQFQNRPGSEEKEEEEIDIFKTFFPEEKVLFQLLNQEDRSDALLFAMHLAYVLFHCKRVRNLLLKYNETNSDIDVVLSEFSQEGACPHLYVFFKDMVSNKDGESLKLSPQSLPKDSRDPNDPTPRIAINKKYSELCKKVQIGDSGWNRLVFFLAIVRIKNILIILSHNKS